MRSPTGSRSPRTCSPDWSGSARPTASAPSSSPRPSSGCSRAHPLLNVEMLSATRKVSQNRSGVDLEVVVGNLDVSNAQTIFLSNYFLRLYASPQYARDHGLPVTLDDVRQHGFVSYVESALQVAELGHRSTQLPVPRSSFQATSIFAQLEAVRRGAGIGLLPNFLVVGDPAFPAGAAGRLPAAASDLGGGTRGIAALGPRAGRARRRSGPRFPTARMSWQAELAAAWPAEPRNGNSPAPAVRGPGCCSFSYRCGYFCLLLLAATSCMRPGGPRCPGHRRRRRRAGRCRGFP